MTPAVTITTQFICIVMNVVSFPVLAPQVGIAMSRETGIAEDAGPLQRAFLVQVLKEVVESLYFSLDILLVKAKQRN